MSADADLARLTFDVAAYLDDARTVGRLDSFQCQHDCAEALTADGDLHTAQGIAAHNDDELYLSVDGDELAFALAEPSGSPVTALGPARVELALEHLPEGTFAAVIAHHGPVVFGGEIVVAPRTPTSWEEYSALDDRDSIVEVNP